MPAATNQFVGLLDWQSQTLATAVDQWVNAVRVNRAAHPTGRQDRRPVLPCGELLSEPLDLRHTLELGYLPYQHLPEGETRARVLRSVQTVGIRVLAANGALRRKLSDLSQEAASCRVLIGAHDRFDVTAFSVLVAASLANLFQALAQSRTSSATADLDLNLVSWPLRLAVERCPQLRPGDLWFADLAARSVRTATERPVAVAHLELLARALPLFTSASLLNKLLEAGEPAFGPDVVKQSQYNLWPGMETLLADPGASSLRRVVCGELAYRVVHDQSLAPLIMVRLIQAAARQDGALATSAQLLVATLLWELLEHSEECFAQLLRQEKLGPALQQAMLLVERPGSPLGPASELRSLADMRGFLRTFSPYASYVRVLAPRGARTMSDPPAPTTATTVLRGTSHG